MIQTCRKTKNNQKGRYTILFLFPAVTKICVLALRDSADLLELTEKICIILHRIKVGVPAGVKLRRHEVWGDVIITCYGATGSILSYPEGKNLWTTYSAADNPHSVELLPGNIFVVASSSGNALRFFDVSSKDTTKYKEVRFTDAHGVLWDPD